MPDRRSLGEDAEERLRSVGGRAAVLLGLSLFYYLTSPGNRTEADDAFWFARDIETAPWPELFDPLHLFFLPLGRIIWKAVAALGGPDRAYPVLVGAGAILAAAAIVLSWDLLVRRFRMEPKRAALAAALLGLVYGIWRYSAEVEVYALILLVVVAVVHLALAAEPGRLERLCLVLLAGLAPFIHILAAVLSAVAVPIAVASRRGWRPVLRYGLATLALGIALGIAGYRLAGSPEEGVVDFYRSGENVRLALAPSDVARHSVAASQVLVSGNFLLTYPPFRHKLAAAFPSQSLEDETFTGMHAPSVLAWVGSATLLAVAASFAWLLAARPRFRRSGASRAARRLALAWLGAHVTTVVLFSKSGQPEAWMLAIFPAWLVFVSIVVSDDLAIAPLAVLVVSLLLHNGFAGLAVYADDDGDLYRVSAAWLIDNTSSADAVLTARGAGFARYLAYWSPARVVDLQFRSPAEVRDGLAAARSVAGRTFATEEIFDPPDYYTVLRPELADSLRRMTRAIRTEFREVTSHPVGRVLQWEGGVVPPSGGVGAP